MFDLTTPVSPHSHVAPPFLNTSHSLSILPLCVTFKHSRNRLHCAVNGSMAQTPGISGFQLQGSLDSRDQLAICEERNPAVNDSQALLSHLKTGGHIYISSHSSISTVAAQNYSCLIVFLNCIYENMINTSRHACSKSADIH